jgi:hypothetical protein
MPKIPEFQQRSEILPQNPPGVDINPNAFGASAAAVGRLAGVASDFAMDLLEKRKQAQDTDYAFTRAQNDQIDYEKFSQDLRLKMPRDYAGYTEAVNEWVQDRYQQNQKDAPSETAKQLYQRHAGPFMEKGLVEASHVEFKNRAEAHVKNFQDDIDRSARLLETTPRSDMALEMLSTFDERAKAATGKIVDAETAKLMNDRAKNYLAKGVLDGLYAKGLENPKAGRQFFQQGMDLLNGTTTINRGAEITRNPLGDGLLPHEKSTYLDKFARAMRENKKTNLEELDRRFRDDIAQVSMGGQMSPTLFKDIDAETAAGNISPEKRVRMYTEHNIADATRSTIEQMKTASHTEWESIIAGHTARVDQISRDFAAKDPSLVAAAEPGFMAAEKKGELARIAAAGQQMLREQATDPAGYVIRNFRDAELKSRMAAGTDPSATQDYIQTQLVRQAQLGIPAQNQRVTTKSEASQLALNLGGVSNEQAAAQQFSMLESKYGRYFPNVFSELVEDNKTDAKLAKYWVASYVNDPYARQRILSNVINSSEIDKAFDAKFSPADRKNLSEAVRAAADPIVSSVSQQSGGGGSLAKANAMNEVVEKEAKKLMLTNGLSSEEAAQKAATVLTGHYGNIQRANSNVTYPRAIGGQPVNPVLLEAFMESHLRADAFAELGVAVPPNAKADEFYGQVERTAKWFQNSAGDGIRLEVQNPVDGRRSPVLRKDGSAIEYKFLDVTQKADQRTLNQAAKGSLRKWLERTF